VKVYVGTAALGRPRRASAAGFAGFTPHINHN